MSDDQPTRATETPVDGRKQSGRGVMPLTGLPRITGRQRRFAERVAAGDTLTDAYRFAYTVNGSKPETVSANASRLAADSRVSAWIDFYCVARVHPSIWAKDGYMEELSKAAAVAVGQGDIKAYIRALELMGKVAGHFVGPAEHPSGRRTAAELLERIRELETSIGKDFPLMLTLARDQFTVESETKARLSDTKDDASD